MARQEGRSNSILAILLNLRLVAVELGHNDKAATYLQEALELARRINYPDQVGILSNLGDATIEQGNYSQAQVYLEEALNLTQQMGNRERQSIVLLSLGKALLEQGQYAQAQVYLEEGLVLARRLGHAQLLCSMLYAWGELALKQQQIETTSAAFEEMQTLIPEGARDLVAQAEYGLARVCAAKGNIDEPRQRGETSLGLFEAIKHRQMSDVREFLRALSVQAEDCVNAMIRERVAGPSDFRIMDFYKYIRLEGR
jgi:tetratricopeptide (TPR) repeat protein